MSTGLMNNIEQKRKDNIDNEDIPLDNILKESTVYLVNTTLKGLHIKSV